MNVEESSIAKKYALAFLNLYSQKLSTNFFANLNDFKQLNGDLSAWVKQISQPKDKPDIKE